MKIDPSYYTNRESDRLDVRDALVNAGIVCMCVHRSTSTGTKKVIFHRPTGLTVETWDSWREAAHIFLASLWMRFPDWRENVDVAQEELHSA